MPKVTKRKAPQESSEGEDFGNDDFSDSESEIIPEDPWKPIVVESEGATRSDYVKVNISLLKNE